jgi:hypothetical protein
VRCGNVTPGVIKELTLDGVTVVGDGARLAGGPKDVMSVGMVIPLGSFVVPVVGVVVGVVVGIVLAVVAVYPVIVNGALRTEARAASIAACDIPAVLYPRPLSRATAPLKSILLTWGVVVPTGTIAFVDGPYGLTNVVPVVLTGAITGPVVPPVVLTGAITGPVLAVSAGLYPLIV